MKKIKLSNKPKIKFSKRSLAHLKEEAEKFPPSPVRSPYDSQQILLLLDREMGTHSLTPMDTERVGLTQMDKIELGLVTSHEHYKKLEKEESVLHTVNTALALSETDPQKRRERLLECSFGDNLTSNYSNITLDDCLFHLSIRIIGLNDILTEKSSKEPYFNILRLKHLPHLNEILFTFLFFKRPNIFPELAALQPNFIDYYSDFEIYSTKIPVCGAILIDDSLEHCLCVRGYNQSIWSFPKGKMIETEGAKREVNEEIGYDITDSLQEQLFISLPTSGKSTKLFVIFRVPIDTHFVTKTRKEIAEIKWVSFDELPSILTHGMKKFIPPLLRIIENERLLRACHITDEESYLSAPLPDVRVVKKYIPNEYPNSIIYQAVEVSIPPVERTDFLPPVQYSYSTMPYTQYDPIHYSYLQPSFIPCLLPSNTGTYNTHTIPCYPTTYNYHDPSNHAIIDDRSIDFASHEDPRMSYGETKKSAQENTNKLLQELVLLYQKQ